MKGSAWKLVKTGIRTLAMGEGRYDPIGCHVGTVWPFDIEPTGGT